MPNMHAKLACCMGLCQVPTSGGRALVKHFGVATHQARQAGTLSDGEEQGVALFVRCVRTRARPNVLATDGPLADVAGRRA